MNTNNAIREPTGLTQRSIIGREEMEYAAILKGVLVAVFLASIGLNDMKNGRWWCAMLSLSVIVWL